MELEEIVKVIKLLKEFDNKPTTQAASNHPMLGKRCLIRTYSARVHIGDVVWINPENSMEG